MTTRFRFPESFLLFTCVVACLFAGCTDSGDEMIEEGVEPSELVVAISVPGTGEVFSGGEMIRFESQVQGGKGPYDYHWTAPLEGKLSAEKAFERRSSDMSKGRHVVILTVTDAAGQESQASVTITTL